MLQIPFRTASPLQGNDDVESNSRERTTAASPAHNEDPEALVRKDTLWINFLRSVLIATLLAVAIGMSVGTFKLLSKMEYDKYRSEFERISTQISFNFIADVSLKIWTARLAARALDTVSTEQGDFLDLNGELLDDITTGAQTTTLWDRIQWSPLLHSPSDRVKWETYALQHMGESKSTANNSNAICYVCGEGMEVGASNNVVTFPNAASYTCEVYQIAGLGGYMPAGFCEPISVYVKAGCKCQPAANNVDAIDDKNATISDHIFRVNKDGKHITDHGPYPMSPIWEGLPQLPRGALLFNQMNDFDSRQAILSMVNSKLPTFSPTRYPDSDYETLLNWKAKFPKCSIYFPVLGQGPKNDTVVGSIIMDFTWHIALAFVNNLPLTSSGVVLVIESNKGPPYTFQVNNQAVIFLGQGDLHDKSYDSLMKQTSFQALQSLLTKAAPRSSFGDGFPETAPLFNLRIYSSEAFKNHFVTNLPAILTAVVASIFVFTSILFAIFDKLVRRRQIKVMRSALQTNEIVTSIFPEFITSRLMANTHTNRVQGRWHLNKGNNNFHLAAPKQQIRNMFGKQSDMTNLAFDVSEPIADFFPSVTVIFADISGFTAWSSEREPTQVFQLLEYVYQTFDKIADKHGVFKIETIGDCYVAVAGLPEPQNDHAVRMARFAHDIMLHMHEAAVFLESQLGPGTGSLSIRVGLHSGPVTGGVLRGDKARFQLFGDTMNTAARMQRTGIVNRIHVSQTTAKLLVDAGCNHWLEKIEAKVNVKGKGDMQTFWVDPTNLEGGQDHQTIYSLPHTGDSGSTCIDIESRALPQRTPENGIERLVDWNTDLLSRFLKNILARRKSTKRRQERHHSKRFITLTSTFRRPIDDAADVIVMSEFCEKKADEQVEPQAVELGDIVRNQVREYVRRIATKYRDNPFHNFEHACHVAMSASKIIKRIVRPEDVDYDQENIKKRDRKKAVAQQIHQSTFGISSDALMQFAVIFSAVIHDVDHTGVSNAQLVKENDGVAIRYDNKCVAEQNSVQIAWDLLMEEQFSDFRDCIYTSTEEMLRFRQLIVNAVIATDIADRDLQMLRKNRWNKAFYESAALTDNDGMSCKATVVFEYIIQASDVAHTMQHWQIYNRWNERLFEERYKAFLAGREEKDPSLGWFNGEIWFFDNYIIPLARKLETCGVFGVSSEEYLNYALENRHEWELKGHEIVQNLIEKYSTRP